MKFFIKFAFIHSYSFYLKQKDFRVICHVPPALRLDLLFPLCYLFFLFFSPSRCPLLSLSSVWELGTDTSAFCWFPPMSALSVLQFFLSCCFCSDASAERGLIKPFSSVFFFFLSSLPPCLSRLLLLSSPCCYRIEQIRESIQCNHDKRLPVVSKGFFFCFFVFSLCACVCLGQGCWEITNKSIGCYCNKHREMIDVWMYGWVGRGRRVSALNVCVYMHVCCAEIDCWLNIGPCACLRVWMRVIMCVCEGGAMLTLELSQQMGDGKGHRLQGMCWLLEDDEFSATLGKGQQD